MKIGDEVFVHGYVDEIRPDTVIIRNDGGYFGTVPGEILNDRVKKAEPEDLAQRLATGKESILSIAIKGKRERKRGK